MTKTLLGLIFSVFLLWGESVVAKNLANSPQVKKFSKEMIHKHGFTSDWLRPIMKKLRHQPKIIRAMTSPAERKPWYQYRKIFLTKRRIKGGVAFIKKHGKTLARAQKKYGVPMEIITAIIGVETFYGGNSGNWKVLDALATLAFGYPKRADFFRNELEQFLLLNREEKLDPFTLRGSYAGAMGLGQFIPSSYRDYAVDFDGDGHRNLWQKTDAIGSVANYFKQHGWQPGKEIAYKVQVETKAYTKLLYKGLKPKHTVATLKSAGVRFTTAPGEKLPAKLLEFQNKKTKEYWVALDNFYVITRYNHSALYAMAVFQLSQEILAHQVQGK